MEDLAKPKSFKEWRIEDTDRLEDAAHTFGYYFMKHCRNQALDKLPNKKKISKEEAVEAINLGFHNVMDLLEGFWELPSGKNKIELSLNVVVKNNDDEEIERLEISPSKIDLPIGYWKWVEEEFR